MIPLPQGQDGTSVVFDKTEQLVCLSMSGRRGH